MCIQGTGFINPFHFNPMVMISSIFHKRISHYLTEKDRLYLLYSIPVQIVGSIVGAFFALWIYDSNFYFEPGAEYNGAQSFFAELIFSSHLVLISIAVGQWAESRLIGLFAISGGITAGIFTVGKISGACFNPTVCFIINFVHSVKTGSSESLTNLWLYIFAPLVGAAIATILGVIIHPKPEEKKHQETTTPEHADLNPPKKA